MAENIFKKIIKKVTAVMLSAAVFSAAVPITTSFLDSTTAFAADNAPAATLEEIENSAKINTGYYGKGKIVDGDLYVWGPHSNIGISSYTDIYGETSTSFPVPYPVKIPEENFDSDVIQVCMNWGNYNFALTENGTVYKLTDTVTKFYESPAGAKIVYLSDVGGRNIFAKDENGKWYSCGSNSGYFSLVETENYSILQPIADEYYDAIGTDENGNKRQIEEILSCAACATLIICTDGTAFTAGTNKWLGLGISADNTYSTPFGELYNLTSALGGVKFVNASADDTAFVAVDTNGNVWGWGCDHTQRFGKTSESNPNCTHGYAHLAVPIPVKFYDSNIYGRKAVRAYTTVTGGDNGGYGNAFILCNDNSIYATGRNINGMIDSTKSSEAQIYNPTKIFTEQSQSDTIVGLSPTASSVTIYTLNGDSYFTGSNSNGAAGNGTTTSPASGEVIEVIPDTMPPTKPYTTNGISFEIEMTRTIGNQQKKVTYVPDPTDDYPNRVIKTVEGSNPVYLNDGMINDDAIPAGQTFKLNVYFEDFGKLHTFLVPIRFNPKYVKAVNGSGETYSDSMQVTSSVGKDGAVEQLFTSENWLNGALASGVDGGYPKINNADGWVSVLGYSTAYRAQITGKQAMFSVKFSAVGSTPASNPFTQFSIATSKNTISGSNPGYDVASKTEFNYGAYWTINNPNSEDQSSSYLFEESANPTFATTVVPMTNFKLDIVRGENEPVDSIEEIDGETVSAGSKAINNKNTDVVYTVKVVPNPTDASFPQVNWTLDLISPDDGITSVSDYISIIEQRDTYIKFKLPDNFSQTQIGHIQFHAQSKTYSALSSDLHVYVKSFDPPEFIHITEKEYSDNTAAATAAKEEFIYNNKTEPEDMPSEQRENKTFTITFPTVADGEPLNKQVVWKLLDKDGSELDTTASSCPVRIVTTSPATDSTAASVTIQPLRTTFGDNYVTLRVESLYDPNVYDTAIIKVQFHANDMKFKQEIVRLPFGMGKDLSELLEIGPQDVYETDLEWTYTPIDTETAYINFNGTSSITANEEATPTIGTDAEKYELVTVTDTISGVSASIKVAVIDLDSPLNIDDIKVTNKLGTQNDVVQIAANLKEGDILRFYKTYEDADAYITTNPLTEVQIMSDFPFVVEGLLDSAGGEIAVSVEREWGDSGVVETSRVPVSYSAEPSKVYGYVALAGKSKTSANIQGIRVDIDGISHSETVYTDENGRFEFEQYIRPGTYTLTVSQNRYLTRIIEPKKSSGYEGLVIPAAEEFCIATQNAPIKLYPGDVNMDNIIDYRDLDVYVKNWVGQINTDLPDFNDFDYDDNSTWAAIGTDDLNLMLIHYGWPSSKYANWSVPEQ